MRIHPESLVQTLYLNLTVVVSDLIEMPYGVSHIRKEAPLFESISILLTQLACLGSGQSSQIKELQESQGKSCLWCQASGLASLENAASPGELERPLGSLFPSFQIPQFPEGEKL